MASPKERELTLRDAEDGPVYAPVDESPLSLRNRRDTPTIAERIRVCKPRNLWIALAIILVIVILIGLLIATSLPKSTDASHYPPLPSADNVKFFFVGFRHGNRNPGQFFKGDTSHEQWAWEGPSQLTNIGKRQAASLGTFLRQRYDKLVSQEFFPSQVKAYSSSAERCQQTLQSCMSGFFPPKGRSIWSTSLNWQPIPYEINDPLLRMYNVRCPEYTNSYKDISDDNSKAARDWLNKDPALIKYIAKNAGFNTSLSDLGDVADNIMNMKMLNIPLPRWVTHPELDGYPPRNMVQEILSYAEAHQVLCANDTFCAKMMAGLWLDNISQTLNLIRAGKLQERRAHFYAAHTETVLSLIRLIQAEHVVDTPTSAGFILEYTDIPAPSIRFIFHEPDPANPDIRIAEVKSLAYCQDQQWCNLDRFLANIRAPAFSDWQSACGLPKCPI